MFDWQEFSNNQLNSIDNSNARINIWEGSVRSGKTIASIVRWLDYIENGPKGDLLMIGKTHRTLKRNILDVLQQIVGESNYSYNRGLGEVYICGRKIYIAGANDARAEDKIRGMTLAGAYGDEITIWPEGFFRMLLSRLSVKDAKLFATTNPEGPYHWLKKDYIDRQDQLDLNDFHFTLQDNLTLDKEYVKQLKQEYTGVWYQRYILGKWVLAEGLVYDMYSKENLYDEKPEIIKEWVGVDYGTANPTSFVLVGLGEDYKLYILDEWRWGEKRKGTAKTDVQLRAELQEFIMRNNSEPKWIFIDPSAKSFITELYQHRREFPQFKRVAKANNNVLDGIRRVSSLVGANKLLVREDLENVKQEFNSYSWDSKAQERGEDKPIKEHDHSLDAIRYVCNGIPNIIEEVLRVGD